MGDRFELADVLPWESYGLGVERRPNTYGNTIAFVSVSYGWAVDVTRVADGPETGQQGRDAADAALVELFGVSTGALATALRERDEARTALASVRESIALDIARRQSAAEYAIFPGLLVSEVAGLRRALDLLDNATAALGSR